MNEELDNVIELMGEDGKIEKVEVLDMIKHNDKDYVMLKHVDEEDTLSNSEVDKQIEEVPVFIAQMIIDESGEYNLQPLTDEAEMEEIFEIFVENVMGDET
jgi:hypothetical protein